MAGGDPVGFDPNNPGAWPWWGALTIDDNSTQLLDENGLPLLVPIENPNDEWVFNPDNPDAYHWWEPLLDENGDPLLDENGDPLLVPASGPPAGSSGGKSSTARRMGHKVNLPQVRRRGAPSAYNRLSQQIEQNNKTALTLSKLIAEALTAMR